MANELLAIDNTTGLTIVANVYNTATRVTTNVTLSEGPTHYYYGNFPSVSAGTYIVYYSINSQIVADETIQWDGAKVIGLPPNPSDENGKITIQRGNDYLVSNNKAIEFSGLGTLPDLTGATATLTATHGGVWRNYMNPWHTGTLTPIAGTITKPTSNPTLTFELPNSITSVLYYQYYRYEIVLTLSDGSTLVVVSGELVVDD